jgi:tRNA(His) 5'-end guanylyltransferase
MKFDDLSIRMKSQYEDRTRYYVPRRTYTILRLDQKSAHTYTKGLNKPFDAGYMEDIDNAIIAMLPEIQGAVLAYTQSDEISILLTDFDKPTTSAWFDGNIQKMSSVAASIMTAEFNRLRISRHFINQSIKKNIVIYNEILDTIEEPSLAYFDCRAFTIPDRIEVMNYFRWRQQDCIRNSVSMVAQFNYSHKELHGKSQSDMHEMLHRKGINWATDFTDGEKNGRVIVKESSLALMPSVDGTIPVEVDSGKMAKFVERSKWVAKGAWVFSKDDGKLLNMIPKYEN